MFYNVSIRRVAFCNTDVNVSTETKLQGSSIYINIDVRLAQD